jgi:hypothetical protein
VVSAEVDGSGVATAEDALADGDGDVAYWG